MARGALAAALALGALAACRSQDEANQTAVAITGGDPARGKQAIRLYGCGTCHAIPGVNGADGKVGPPLGGIASRAYIAGVLPNEPGNMMKWIMNPQAVDSQTAMPVVGVTERDARHIAAYLYTLR